MADYIDRQAAIDIVVFECGKWTGLAKEISKQLKQLPADVVQVVRCDDCEYYGSRRWCELHSSVFDDNAFCSHGERREE